MKMQEILVGKFEFNSYGTFTWALPELHYTPRPVKDTTQNQTQNGIGLITSYCSREDPVGTCRPDSRNREISRNQA